MNKFIKVIEYARGQRSFTRYIKEDAICQVVREENDYSGQFKSRINYYIILDNNNSIDIDEEQYKSLCKTLGLLF